MSILFNSALQGLGAGLNTYGQDMLREEEMRRRQALEMAELEKRAEMLGARSGLGGSSRGGKASNLFDAADAQSKVNFASGMSPEEQQSMQDGTHPSLFTQRELPGPPQMVDGQEVPAGAARERADGWEALRQRKLDELRSLRETVAVGGDVKDMSKARLDDQKRGQLDRFEAGSSRAGEAALIGDGKPVYDGNSDVTRNEVTGATKATDVGQADIKKKGAEAASENAQAGKYKAEADKARSEIGDPKTVKTEKLSSTLNSIAATLKSLTENPPNSKATPDEKKQYQDTLSTYRALQASIGNELKARGAAPVANNPSPSAQSGSAGTPPASVLKEGVNTRFKNGQVWTLKNGVPTRVN